MHSALETTKKQIFMPQIAKILYEKSRLCCGNKTPTDPESLFPGLPTGPSAIYPKSSNEILKSAMEIVTHW